MHWMNSFQENYGILNEKGRYRKQKLLPVGIKISTIVFQSGVDCTEEVSSLFRGELNPVAAKAQKKVQIPEGFVQTYLLFFT